MNYIMWMILESGVSIILTTIQLSLFSTTKMSLKYRVFLKPSGKFSNWPDKNYTIF